jgi:hypothetical protein
VTAFTATTGDNYFDGYTGGSTNATLDTYTISGGARLIVRTDTYACANHSTAFGSLDTVSFTGQGGTLRIDPTYVRVIAYTGGSGNAPAYGTTITANNGTTGVFLGAWTNWLSEPITPGSAIGATGFIKLGGVSSPGNFNAGVLSGITATCSGADVQGWIEVRGGTDGAGAGGATFPRIGKMECVEAWFEIGTTNGTAGQVIACPTCATTASVFPGVWIETSAGSGVYEPYGSLGTVVALATQRTDAGSMKVVTQTTGGIRIGNDGTNNVFYLPPTGCKVRIPAAILTNCVRSAGNGSGPRVLPHATLATRYELVTTGAGYFDLRGMVSQWYMNLSQAYYAKYQGCAIADTMILSEVASPLDVDNCIVAPTVAQLNFALNVISCFAGGTIQNSVFNRFSLAASGAYVAQINYVTGVTFSGNTYRSGTLRANATTGVITSTQAKGCTFSGNKHIGGRALFVGAQGCTFSNTSYWDHGITTTTSSTNSMSVYEFTTGGSGNTVDGITLPLAANGPYTALVTINACYNTLVKNFGTYASKLTLNSSVTGLGINSVGNSDGITVKRVYLANTRTGPYAFVNSDTNVLLEHVYGDYADTSVIAALNCKAKNCGLTGATTGQTSVYGTHWLSRFTSTTAGFLEILCNEPTATSAAQCAATGGTPQFNSSGQVLLTKVGDAVEWQTDWWVIGYTALTNSAPTITGTNVTYSSGARWGNHDIEYQIDTGSGWNGTWLALTAANLSGHTISATTGFKVKVRATCATASATNALTNLRIAMTTTNAAQGDNLYPLSLSTVTFTGLPTGCDAVTLTAGTTTILDQRDSLAGTSYAYQYEGTPTVDVGFIKPGYVPYYFRNLALGATDSSIPVSLSPDRNYA